MPLHVVKGTPPPDTKAERVRARLRASPKPAGMLQCPRCAGRELIETKIGATLESGRVKGGTKQHLCALCLMQGHRVVIA